MEAIEPVPLILIPPLPVVESVNDEVVLDDIPKMPAPFTITDAIVYVCTCPIPGDVTVPPLTVNVPVTAVAAVAPELVVGV